MSGVVGLRALINAVDAFLADIDQFVAGHRIAFDVGKPATENYETTPAAIGRDIFYNGIGRSRKQGQREDHGDELNFDAKK
jgi:hypothetical protein